MQIPIACDTKFDSTTQHSMGSHAQIICFAVQELIMSSPSVHRYFTDKKKAALQIMH